ncbi:unnamed protein product [Rotaria socialis]|uniref:beta-N-acetylhexosaminidase n=1 Tax=Rotaria socialis TaxID=392032 RepID=A0A818S2C6_9BILA|nr:unnamed protein product [Rotaria socialis]
MLTSDKSIVGSVRLIESCYSISVASAPIVTVYQGQGAFTPDHVYTPADVSDVIEHARLRGIRGIPEIDTPGHTYSWRKAMPELITVCWANGKPNQAIYGNHSEMEIFNPI